MRSLFIGNQQCEIIVLLVSVSNATLLEIWKFIEWQLFLGFVLFGWQISFCLKFLLWFLDLCSRKLHFGGFRVDFHSKELKRIKFGVIFKDFARFLGLDNFDLGQIRFLCQGNPTKVWNRDFSKESKESESKNNDYERFSRKNS